MSGILKELHRESFTSQDTIAISHNSNTALLRVRVVVDGKADTSLIEKVERDLVDPLNKITVYLNSVSTGYIQILEADSVSSPSFGTLDDGVLLNQFGVDAQYVSSPLVSTSTLDTFIDKIDMTTTALDAGTYRISWNYGWSSNSTVYDFAAQLILVGEGSGGSDIVLSEHQQEPSDSFGTWGSTGTNQKHRESGFVYYTFSTDAVHNLKLQWRSTNVGTQASIWGAVVEVWKVS